MGLQRSILKHFGVRFGADEAFGTPWIDFQAFWGSPGPDLDDGAIGPPGFDFDAFSKFPGPEVEVMGHLGLGDDCGASVGPNGHLGF